MRCEMIFMVDEFPGDSLIIAYEVCRILQANYLSGRCLTAVAGKSFILQNSLINKFYFKF